MVRIAIKFRANLENVKSLKPCGEDFRWYLKLLCANCGEVTNWQYVTLEMTAPLKGGRGNANMVEKCKMCARENSIDIMKTHLKSYLAEDDSTEKVIVAFECRGMEPVDFDLRCGWEVESALSKKIFPNVDLKEKEWYDYDEHGGETISITDVTFRFMKIKNC